MEDYDFLFEEELILERPEHANSEVAKRKASQRAAQEEAKKKAQQARASRRAAQKEAEKVASDAKKGYVKRGIERAKKMSKKSKVAAGVAAGTVAVGAGVYGYNKLKNKNEGANMNKKNIKAIVLEHWFGIDRILFGESFAKNVLEGDIYHKYITSKGCLLSNLFELYNKINYDPELPEFKTVNDILESAVKRANIAKEATKALLEKADVAKVIRDEIKDYGDSQGLTEGQVAKLVVSRKFKSAAIDSMLLEEAIKTSCKLCLTDWKAKVLLDAHKVMRDTLVEASENMGKK